MSESEVPSKEEILRNMAKRLQTHPQDGSEIWQNAYKLIHKMGRKYYFEHMTWRLSKGKLKAKIVNNHLSNLINVQSKRFESTKYG